MSSALSRLARIELAPPRYLAFKTAGIDVSASGVKIAIVEERMHGFELVSYGEVRLNPGAYNKGEITDRSSIVEAVRTLARKHHISFANIGLAESRSYLFEASISGATAEERHMNVQQHLDEYVPLPPAEVTFDIVETAQSGDPMPIVGVGYASRVIEESLSIFEEAGVEVCAVESEMFSVPRALLHLGNPDTVLIIDIGRTTTKLSVVSAQIPRFATTLDIGGHALTLAVQKHFGVTEEEAKRVKAEHGIVGGGETEYLEAMLSTVSAIREEIARRLDYWQSHATPGSGKEPVTRAILVGGNATVRGLPEYLESSLKIPVELGDVFANMAPKDTWLPPLDYYESLAYATAIGLALRDYDR